MNSTDADVSQISKIRVLMVDDQPLIGETVRHMLADQQDIEFFFCPQPTRALAEAARVKPTVILQDLVMPDVDGLTLVKFFRANPATHEIPLVMLSSREDPDVKYKAFELGANDYMVKFPDKLEVIARIRYHSKAYTNFCERNRAMKELQASQQVLKSQLDEAEKYVKSLLPKKLDDNVLSTDWVFKSSSELGGDCFGYEWIDAQNFAVYLLDVCGHGVGAALLSVSAINALRSQSLAGVDFKNPDEVLGGLNTAFDMDKQNGMYFTIWYGVYNKLAKTLTYSSGGHPPAILVSDGKIQKLRTAGMVVGGIVGVKFAKGTISVPNGAKLYVFSDGVYEVDHIDGSGMMTVDEFANQLLVPSESGLSKPESMMKFSQRAQNRESFEDDFSLCEINFKSAAMKKIYSAKLVNLEIIASDVEQFCAANNADMLCFPINLCLDELFTNIVTYGYNEDETKNVEIEIVKESDGIRIFVRDTAPQFNPLEQVREPDITSGVDQREIGGLGVFFLRKNMDELSYKYENATNEIMMFKKSQ